MDNISGFIIIHKSWNKKEGCLHDFDIYKKNQSVTLNQAIVVVNVFDLGYLGVGNDFTDQISLLPYRKKRNHKFSQEEKEYNKSHSKRKRVIKEQTI